MTALVLAAGVGQAAVLHTSARVQIMPGVDILRVGSAFERQTDGSGVRTIRADGVIGFRVDGPADQAVHVAWAGLVPTEADARPIASDHRHDESGRLFLKYDHIADRCGETPTAGLLLTLEYE